MKGCIYALVILTVATCLLFSLVPIPVLFIGSCAILFISGARFLGKYDRMCSKREAQRELQFVEDLNTDKHTLIWVLIDSIPDITRLYVDVVFKKDGILTLIDERGRPRVVTIEELRKYVFTEERRLDTFLATIDKIFVHLINEHKSYGDLYDRPRSGDKIRSLRDLTWVEINDMGVCVFNLLRKRWYIYNQINRLDNLPQDSQYYRPADYTNRLLCGECSARYKNSSTCDPESNRLKKCYMLADIPKGSCSYDSPATNEINDQLCFNSPISICDLDIASYCGIIVKFSNGLSIPARELDSKYRFMIYQYLTRPIYNDVVREMAIINVPKSKY